MRYVNKRCIAFFVPLLAILAFAATASAAEAPGTGWQAFSLAGPTNLHPGGSGEIQVYMINTGAQPSAGSITVTDTLPAGLIATKAGGMPSVGHQPLSPQEEKEGPGSLSLSVEHENVNASGETGARWICNGNGSGGDIEGDTDISGATVITCTSNPEFLQSQPRFQKSEINVTERLGVQVKVEPSAREGASPNRITVAGGGAATPTDTSDPVTISSTEPGFGFPLWDVWFSNADGSTDTQAGSHPYAATFVSGFNELSSGLPAGGDVRNLEADLPPGFFGEPGAMPQCTRTQLDALNCPYQSQIGADLVGKPQRGLGPAALFKFAVYNMVPPAGVPDEFAFTILGKNVIFDAGVRSDHGYPIVEHIDNIAEVNTDFNLLTLWGVPGEASHDSQRCQFFFSVVKQCGASAGVLPKPFLTLPTSCQQPGEPAPAFGIRGLATWQDPNATAEATVRIHNDDDGETGLTGCGKLSIEPSLTTVPDTAFADTPAGLAAEVKVPQETLRIPGALVAATLKNTTVTLPEGVAINPGQAAGLQACQAAQAKLEEEGPAECPAASKVGIVKIQTPLLENEPESELTGDVYVLQSNPPHLKLLVTASADGVDLKLPGSVELNEQTGQITTTFEETPELPFTDFKLSFSGGAQAALATPTQCGAYTTSSDFTPWTSPFAVDVLGSNSFQITAGPGGGACPPSSLPFSPSLTAGSTTDQAGGFTNFSLLLQRGDGQQRIDGLQFKAPAGLTGELAKVPLCPEPQAAEGKCSEASKIGHAIVESGPGPYPLEIPEPGKPESQIYLTGPYKGAPFGLTITTHVLAGPFDLEQGTPCDCIVTRARIEVDPITAALTITTDPLPQIVAGVPTDLREIDSVIERPEFMINPTNCNPSEFSGTAYGTPPPGQGGPGARATISSHFQVGSCQSLKFEPKFSVSTSGKTSKAKGASLTTKVSYPNVPQGTDVDIARVKVELPKQLPSRLTTLQKACTDAQFELNPANCPSESMIGYAVVHTPLLPVPLEGPAIFVSHGGEAFPSLTMVLQGDNVKVDLVGTTFISKAGITSTTFKTLPDSPFSSFELTLPEGKFSALAANGNLCAPTTSKTVKKKVKVKVKGRKKTETRKVTETKPTTLTMPNEFVAQNGAVIKQTSTIAVTGCSKAKPAKKATKKKKKGKGKKTKK